MLDDRHDQVNLWERRLMAFLQQGDVAVWEAGYAAAYELGAYDRTAGWMELAARLWDAMGDGGPVPEQFSGWVVPLVGGRFLGQRGCG